jgi:hypothetical protein
MLHIDTPLPTNIQPGDEHPLMKAEWLDLLFRKLNAIYGMRAIPPLRLTKAESGWLLSVDQ